MLSNRRFRRDKLAIIVLSFIALAFLFTEYNVVRNRQQLSEWDEKLRQDSFLYENGFYAGVRATTKYICYDTNSGKMTLALTNVMAELEYEITKFAPPRVAGATAR